MGGTARRPRGPEPPDREGPTASGLRRTAVLLTGDPHNAAHLVEEVLDGDGWKHGHHPATRELQARLVHTFLRQSPHGVLEESPDRECSDAGDVLETLRPRERAAAVLVLLEGWSSREAGLVLARSPSWVEHVASCAEGLPEALSALAEEYAEPAPLRESPVAVRREEPQATSSSPRSATEAGRADLPAGRRRLLPRSRAARTLVAVLGVVALGLAGRLSGEDPARDDSHEEVTAVQDGRLTDSLEARGWVLGPDGSVPDHLEGLWLVERQELDLAGARTSLTLDTRPRSGVANYAVLWCELPATDAHLRPPTLRITVDGEDATVACAGTSGSPPVLDLVPLPPGPGRQQAEIRWSGDVPDRGTATLATYTELGAAPAASGRPAGAPPVVGHGDVVVNASSPSFAGDLTRAPAYPHRPESRTYSVRVELGPGSRVTAWSGDTGTMVISLGGVQLTDDTGPPAVSPGQAPWRASEHELRAGRWYVYRPDRLTSFEVPAQLGAGPAVLTVAPDVGEEWQVVVSQARPAGAEGPLPLVDSTAPPWLGGHRLVASWSVPRDGGPHLLAAVNLPEGTRFLQSGPATSHGFLGAHGLVLVEGRSLRIDQVERPADAFGDPRWLARDTGWPAPSGVAIPVVALSPGGADEDGIVHAYAPVPFDTFRFEGAPRLPISTDPEDLPTELAWVAQLPVLAELTVADGRARYVSEKGGQLLLEIRTEGPGRLRILENGMVRTDVAPVFDGWWSTWTDLDCVSTLILPTFFRGGATTLDLQVEGWGDEEVRVTVREFHDPGRA